MERLEQMIRPDVVVITSIGDAHQANFESIEQKVEQKPEYESFVSYWMPFNGGIGMHDATWRGSFGGSIYMYSGSHGCINMPPAKAAELYGMLPIGTPVVIHY